MEFRDYVAVLRKYWVSIVVCTLAGFLASLAYLAVTPPTYTSQSKVVLGVKSGTTPAELVQALSYSTTQAKTAAELVSTPTVLDGVIKALGLNTTSAALSSRVSATIPAGTAMIVIDVRDGSATQAAKIAQGAAENLKAAVEDQSPTDTNGKAVVQVTIAAPAAIPVAPVSPRKTQSLALGIIAGLVLGVGLAILRKAVDVRVHTAKDVTDALTYPVIASIPRDSSLIKDPVIMLSAPASPTGECYRQLRTNLQFFDLDSDAPWTFAVTSAIEGEGKTVTSINIAYALAESGDKVLLIDADLRRPRIATYLHLETHAGLTTVLLNRAGFADVVQPLGVGCPDVLAAGSIPPNPAELIGSRRMKQFLEQVSREYSTVVIDAAPLLPVADTLALLPHVSGTVIVSAAEKVTVPQLKTAVASVERAGAQIMGIVVNKIRRQGGPSDYYTYAHEYADEGPEAKSVPRSRKRAKRAEG